MFAPKVAGSPAGFTGANFAACCAKRLELQATRARQRRTEQEVATCFLAGGNYFGCDSMRIEFGVGATVGMKTL